jgi:hypothetical protein
MDGVGFIFHDPIFGGAPGDATLEWLFKVPSPSPGHSSLFWTNTDDNGSTNLFNVFFHINGVDVVAGDFGTDVGGEAIGVFDNGSPVDLDTWHHVAIVRTVSCGGEGGANGPPASSFDWTWYVNGVESRVHATTTTLPMPTSNPWLIAGRGNASSFRGFMDEIRMTDRAPTALWRRMSF